MKKNSKKKKKREGKKSVIRSQSMDITGGYRVADIVKTIDNGRNPDGWWG